MMRTAGCWLAAMCALVLTACASAPLHYYTLVAPEPVAAAAQPLQSATVPFEVLPVGVPAQVDQPQLVVRDGPQRVLLLDGERWIAPLSDELRSALAADLATDLHSENATGVPDNGQPRLRVKLDVRHFDSWPGSYALLAGTWSVRLLNGRKMQAGDAGPVTCTSTLRESVGDGYAALVRGHQQAIAALSAQIAGVARALGAGQPAACPAP